MTETKAELQEAQKPLAHMFMEAFDWKDKDDLDMREKGMLLEDIYTAGFLPYCKKFEIPERYIPRYSTGFGRKIKPYVWQETKTYRGKKQQRVYFPVELELKSDDNEDEVPESMKPVKAAKEAKPAKAQQPTVTKHVRK
jgi:hypothetical protein